SALTLLTAAAFAAGTVFALVAGGLRASAENVAVVRKVAGAALAVLATVALVGGIAAVGNPVSYAQEKYREFHTLDPGQASDTRLGSVGGQRYDLWRIAWDEFKAEPVHGVGAASYPFGYYRERRTDRNLTDPHSLPMALLAETGIVG